MSASPRRPLTVWELPKLLEPVHRHRPAVVKSPKDRPHFPAILAFVYRNRFAIAQQIQRRFGQYLPSDRTARRHLAEMEALGYLDLVPTLGVSPLFPKVYSVSRKGLRRLREAFAKKGKQWREPISDRRRSEGYSALHVMHELCITEFLLEKWEESQSRPDFELLQVERRS
ncbi:MAG: replication-relaxation family protein, partial [Planctomycetaceae bacterium]